MKPECNSELDCIYCGSLANCYLEEADSDIEEEVATICPECGSEETVYEKCEICPESKHCELVFQCNDCGFINCPDK